MKLGFMISCLFYLVSLMLIQNEVSCKGCLENERIGLLDIKHFMVSHRDVASASYFDDELVSWVDDRSSNCCAWNRVTCSNISSGHITELNLGWSGIQISEFPVMLNVSLLHPFEEIRLLDLSGNRFEGFIGKEGFPQLKKLKTLDLSSNFLNGSILSSLNGLTALTTLDLSQNQMGNNFSTQGFITFKKLKTLNMSRNNLNDIILSSLNGLSSLTTLSLGDNSIGYNFSATGFPQLKKLKTLDLSANGLNGSILSNLNGLTALTTLDLSQNQMGNNFSTQDMQNWRNLKLLDLSYNYIDGSIEGFSKLQELEDLDLSANDLSCSDLSNLFGLTSLKSLKLHDNNFNCSLLLLDMQNLRNLKSLDLSNSHIDGSIEGLCKLKDLIEFDISYNMLSAPLPECLSNLTNLKVLNLGYNLISGNFPSFISNLTSLTHLSLYKNYMKGSFSLSTLANHSKLQALYISSQSIGAHIETENIKWLPKFQLKYLVIRNCSLNMDKGNVIPSFLSYQSNLILIDMSSNKLVGSFPSWLQNNDGIQYLDISNNNLSGLLPKDIDIFLPTVTYLKISQNSFKGNIPGSIGKMKKVIFLDFSYNHFSGYIPKNLVTECNELRYLKLSNNFLQGNIPKFSNLMYMRMLFLNNNNFTGNLEDVFGNNTRLGVLDISNNSISGTIPSSIGMHELYILLMNENQLEGYIPVEISNNEYLKVLDLSQNKLIGSIPNLSSLNDLKYLYLQKNNLSGYIPFELSRNSQLEVLDLRDNKFSGKIPNWLDKLSSLSVLLLGGNNLNGDIPIQLCRLKNINIMDLSRNMLKSSIPSCFQNLSFGQDDDDISDFTVNIEFLSKYDYEDSFLTPDDMKVDDDLFDLFDVEQSLEVEFRTKNNYYFYKGKILGNMTGLDLSCNKLTGIIPYQIGNLEHIRALNLSHNYLSGHIPITFSNLTQIESLDLSYNNLSGKIPGELTQLNFLSNFNVSYNNFSGTPPNTGQFGDFDEENYKGNPGLCGPLLDRKCDSVAPSPSSQPHDSGEKESKVDMISFYWSFAASYLTILLSIITVLYINENWRMAWFYFISKTIRKRFPNFPKLY